jgi:hypothetical protein
LSANCFTVGEISPSAENPQAACPPIFKVDETVDEKTPIKYELIISEDHGCKPVGIYDACLFSLKKRFKEYKIIIHSFRESQRVITQIKTSSKICAI